MQPSNAIMQWATTAGLPYPGKGGKRKTYRRKHKSVRKHKKTQRRYRKK